MHLSAFLQATGHHVAAWRHPDAVADAGTNFRHYRELARTAERGLFDAIFLADVMALDAADPAVASLRARYTTNFDPLTLLAGLASATDRIGLIATASTTYNEPFHIARKFASIDHISGGRSGWNLVTTETNLEAQNFGRQQHIDHEARYDRAREFAEVVKGLWDSFEDDAFVHDKINGRFFEPGKLHILQHKGRHFEVRGPLNVARSPQGQPVIVQAGSSETGKEFAARFAEVVFTAQDTLSDAQAFYSDVKGRLARYGRSPDTLKILPGVFPVVGRTHQEAIDKFEFLQSLIQPEVGLALLSAICGEHDFTGYPLDGPVPLLPETNGAKSRQQLLIDLAKREGLTLRQLYQRVAGSRGHWCIIGTPESVADELEERFRGGGADGYNVMPPILPNGLEDFVELVVPKLQRRGLFRTEYTGRTLRDHLQLPYPLYRVSSRS